VLGPECLEAAIGPDPSLPEVRERDPAQRARVAATVAFAVAVISTALPWSRFGAGSDVLGAWSDTPAWSMVAASAASLGLVISLVGSFTRRAPPILDVLAALAGLTLAAACVLALVRPRPFTSPWLGPWVALGAGFTATVAAIGARIRSRGRVGVHV
jgi:asparagine N-glycosylation enzyme membrane subunit Stt3